MEYEVILETTADTDLHGILNYITDVLKEPETALRIFSTIEEKVLSLDKLPHRYATAKDEPYKSFGVRWMPIENYIVFFVIDEERHTVHVLRILYSRRNWQAVL